MRVEIERFRLSAADLAFWSVVVISALLVVWSTHTCRDLFTQLMVLQAEENELQVAHGRFMLQEGALDSPMRLEQIAKDRLQMRIPPASEIMVIRK